MAGMTRTYPQGVPCWVDLNQSDLDGAMRFYGGLFGWSSSNAMPPDAPGAYMIATLDGQDAAALAPGEGGDGWVSYIACDDADQTAAAIARAGGTIVDPPEDAGPGGRAATCLDPQGAGFRLWQARRRPGAQAVNEPGAWNFSDLATPDAEQAMRFYRDVFGWVVSPELGAGMVRLPGYGDFLASGPDPDIHRRQEFAPEGFDDVIAGLSPADSEARWWIRFAVADRDESADRARSLGGMVTSVTDTDWTREAVIEDPQGAAFIISQLVVPG
ncbi:VOC family protein [Microbacterium sp. P02]|uniref:VOC family protein n=1 Tax=Microbacterium sp. P02 TaxID=3366260 RepID=UPI0036734FB7